MRGRVVVAVVALLATACSSGDDAADQLAVDGEGTTPTTESDALTRVEGSDAPPATDAATVTGDDATVDDDQDVPPTDAPVDPASDDGGSDTADPEPASTEPGDTGSGGGGGSGDGGTGSSSATTVAGNVSTTEAGGSAGSEPAATTPPAGTTASGDVVAFFPDPLVELVQGGEAWAVVLAGATAPDDAALRDAELAAEDAGYRTGPTDCDAGAPEALGLTAGGVFTVSVYFSTEGDAASAAAAFAERGIAGEVALVQTFCLD